MEPAARSAVRVPKTAELVADVLRRQIVLGELQEGEALPPEATLMATFEVSRPTLRESFRVLESEGLIAIHRGSRGGARVRAPNADVVARYAGLVLEHSRATIVDVSTARAVLEPPCVRAIAERGDPGVLEELRQAIEQADALEGDPDAQLAAQHAFHQLVVDRAGNLTISLLHGAIQRILDQADAERALIDGVTAAEARQEGARAHRKLVELLEQGKAGEAERLWRHHIESTTEYLMRTGGAASVLDLL
jgi:DNA-binding FadR family transcriptional regulator